MQYEWVSEWYGKIYYRLTPGQNPQSPESESTKIMREGSLNPLPELVKTTDRHGNIPGARGRGLASGVCILEKNDFFEHELNYFTWSSSS